MKLNQVTYLYTLKVSLKPKRIRLHVYNEDFNITCFEILRICDNLSSRSISCFRNVQYKISCHRSHIKVMLMWNLNLEKPPNGLSVLEVTSFSVLFLQYMQENTYFFDIHIDCSYYNRPFIRLPNKHLSTTYIVSFFFSSNNILLLVENIWAFVYWSVLTLLEYLFNFCLCRIFILLLILQEFSFIFEL